MERDDFAISPGFWRGTREEFQIDQQQLATMAGVAQSDVAGLEMDGTGSLDLKLKVLEAFLCLCAAEDEAREIGAIASEADCCLA
jgi:predicted transcriptional regulator